METSTSYKLVFAILACGFCFGLYTIGSYDAHNEAMTLQKAQQAQIVKLTAELKASKSQVEKLTKENARLIIAEKVAHEQYLNKLPKGMINDLPPRASKMCLDLALAWQEALPIIEKVKNDLRP